MHYKKNHKGQQQYNNPANLTPQELIGLNESDDEILELVMNQIW